MVSNEIWNNVVMKKLELTGEVIANNRIWRSAAWLGMANPDGSVSDKLIDAYSKIKAGLVLTGFQYITPEGKFLPSQISNSKSEDIEGLKRLADAIHSTGSLAGAQLVHCGAISNPEWWGGEYAYGPSDAEVPLPTGTTNKAKAMTIEQIEQITEAYGEAAKRAADASFDAVEIHGAHHFQLWQFFDPHYNKRPADDPYTGTTFEGRSKAMVDAITAVKKAVNIPILVKVDSSSQAVNPEEVGKLVKKIVPAGANLITFSGPNPSQNHNEVGEAYFLENVKTIIKIAGDTNVFYGLVGGIRSSEMIVKLLSGEEGNGTKFDIVQLARPLMSEPALIDRWNEEAKSNELTPARCASCNGCFGAALSGNGAECTRFKGQ